MSYIPIVLFIASIAISILGVVAKYLFGKIQDHEKRVQKVEDLHGNKLDSLEKKIDQMQITIQTLANNLHKEKNVESALVATLTALNKTIEHISK